MTIQHDLPLEIDKIQVPLLPRNQKSYKSSKKKPKTSEVTLSAAQQEKSS
jgi:hypothetical protein